MEIIIPVVEWKLEICRRFAAGGCKKTRFNFLCLRNLIINAGVLIETEVGNVAYQTAYCGDKGINLQIFN